MKRADFGPESPGELVATINGLDAFVPDRLPPSMPVEDLFGELQAAALSIGELRGGDQTGTQSRAGHPTHAVSRGAQLLKHGGDLHHFHRSSRI